MTYAAFGRARLKDGGCGPVNRDALWGEALPDRMSNEKKPMKTTTGARARTGGKARSPEWATGLRRLYDSVVEEPLPDSFAQLLDQLDNPPHD